MSGSSGNGTFWSAQDTGIDPRWYQTGEAVRAPFADVAAASAGQAWQENPGVGLFRYLQRESANMAADPNGIGADIEAGGGAPVAREPFLSAEEAQSQYGIPGHLNFTRPMAQSSAVALRDMKRAELVRKDTLERAESGVGGWTARIGIGLAVGAVDPLNIASAFIPVVGEARAAGWLAQAGSRLGRAGAAARVGAIEGVAGAALLEPLNHFLADQEQRDYGMVDSLLNIGFGAVLGGLMHSGGRAAVDGWQGWRAPDRAVIEQTHEGAMRSAIAQVSQGEPVNVEPVIAAGRMFGDTRREQLMGSTAIPPETVPAARLAPVEQRYSAEGPDGWVLRADRSPDLAVTPAGITGAPSLPIRLSRGWHNANTSGGKGLEHIAAQRAGQIGDPAEFVADVAANFNELRRQDDGTLFIVRRDPERAAPRQANDVLVAALRENPNGYYDVITAGKFKNDYVAKRELLWQAEHPADLPPSGLEAPSSTTPQDMSGSAGPSSARDQSGPILSNGRQEFNSEPPSPEQLSAMLSSVAKQVVRAGDAASLAQADAARVRYAAAGGRLETAVGKVDAEGAAIDKRLADIDAVLREHLASGRITEADMAALESPAAAAKAADRDKGIAAAAACLIANGA